MDSLTTDELLAIQARLERAQVGPWRADTADKAGENWPLLFTAGDDDEGRRWVVQTDGIRASETNGATAKDDAEFVAAARTDIPRLLATVRHLMDQLVGPDERASLTEERDYFKRQLDETRGRVFDKSASVNPDQKDAEGLTS